MESEPAYKRRNIDLKDVKYSDEPNVLNTLYGKI